MTWKELLITLRQDVLNDRSARVDGDADTLWSDATLIRYLNEAQRRFARRTCCIRDGSSPVTLLTVVQGQREYPLDASIIAVVSARWIGSGNYQDPNAYLRPQQRDLMRGGHDVFEGMRPRDSVCFDYNALEQYRPGMPVAFSTDEETRFDANGTAGQVVVRVFPVASTECVGGQIQMRVIRNATALANGDDLSTYPEIPEDYHLALIDYAAYLALKIVDHELGDPTRAAEMQASFDRQVDLAKRETMRKLFAPQTWGFGRGGFAYVGN